jgi:hypothetical protein
MGIEMDSIALDRLIAEVRGTTAMLAEAEQRVAKFKDELAQQKLPDVGSPIAATTPRPVSTGWIPANG